VTDLFIKCPDLKPIVDRAAEVSAYLWEKGWAERNAGNLSIDVTDLLQGITDFPGKAVRHELQYRYPVIAGRFFLVTGSGHRFRDMAKDATHNACVLRMTKDGGAFDILWGGSGKPEFRPTSEFPSHLRIHEMLRERGDPAKVVLHTHPTELICLTHMPEYQSEEELNRALWAIHPEVKITIPRGAGLALYNVPGSEELAIATVEAFKKNHRIALWQLHGCVAIGTEVMEAFDLIDTLNKAAGMILLCRGAGYIPSGLTKEQLAELVRAFNLKE
jgi:rhamnulose-1-phosphate aldolase